MSSLAPRANAFDVSVLGAGISLSDWRMLVLPVLVGSVLAFAGPNAEAVAMRFRPSLRTDVTIVCMLLVAYMYMSAAGPVEFRYRQF